MLVHGTGHSLDELGIEKMPYESHLSFRHLACQLGDGSAIAKQFRFLTVQHTIHEVLGFTSGIYGVHCYFADAEDLADTQITSSDHIREVWKRFHVETQKHFVVINNDTNVIFIAPELFIPTKEQKATPQLMLDRLRKPPYSLVFDTSLSSRMNIRQLALQVCEAACGTRYNAPECIQELMSKAGKKHRAYWEEEAGRRVAARLGSEVPIPEEVEVEVEVEGESLPCCPAASADVGSPRRLTPQQDAGGAPKRGREGTSPDDDRPRGKRPFGA